jgi:predicted short-subunit dehydrogenase-like oxidoreductase (DUF2520 family)
MIACASQIVAKSDRKRSMRPLPSVAIIGPGNWGTSLLSALLSAGVPIRELVVRAGSSVKRLQRRPIRVVPITEATLDASILWICVPDSSITEVTEQIVRRKVRLDGQIVVHSSGALTVKSLYVAQKAGAGVGSIHPVMSFPTRDRVPLKNVMFGVESLPDVRRKLFALVKSFGGKPFALASENKALYHAAGTFASPLLVSALSAAVATARAAGLSSTEAQSLIAPLAQATVRNFFGRGPGRSFSGPLARGDAATIDLHLKALKKHPILADTYRALARHALDALPVRHREELRRVLERASPSKPVRRKP